MRNGNLGNDCGRAKLVRWIQLIGAGGWLNYGIYHHSDNWDIFLSGGVDELTDFVRPLFQ